MDVMTQSAVITLCALGFALILVVGAYVRLLRTPGVATVGLLEGMGGPSWDFSQSWATTLATVGGVLNTVLVAGALTQTQVPSGLGAFFGILALLGPFAFSALLLHRLRQNASAPGLPQYEGCVAGFLLACLLTIWGVTGQIGTTITLCLDLANQSALSWAASVALIVCLALAVLGVAVYAWRTIPNTIAAQRNEAQAQMKMSAGQMQVKLYDEAAKPALPRWTVL